MNGGAGGNGGAAASSGGVTGAAGSSGQGGGSAGGAASVPSGISRHAIADGTSAFPLVDARGLSISPGVYYLRVWGYGVGSPLVAVAVGGATDPSGTPTDMPSAPN